MWVQVWELAQVQEDLADVEAMEGGMVYVMDVVVADVKDTVDVGAQGRGALLTR